MGLNPQYNMPQIKMSSVVGPTSVEISLYSEDYKSFIESLLSIKEGGKKTFSRVVDGNVIIKLEIINAEASKIMEET